MSRLICRRIRANDSDRSTFAVRGSFYPLTSDDRGLRLSSVAATINVARSARGSVVAVTLDPSPKLRREERVAQLRVGSMRMGDAEAVDGRVVGAVHCFPVVVIERKHRTGEQLELLLLDVGRKRVIGPSVELGALE